jgi:hypothetical protein
MLPLTVRLEFKRRYSAIAGLFHIRFAHGDVLEFFLKPPIHRNACRCQSRADATSMGFDGLGSPGGSLMKPGLHPHSSHIAAVAKRPRRHRFRRNRPSAVVRIVR